MAESRKELEEALCCYTTDTLIYIDTVRGFCEMISEWMLRRETESKMMMDIKDRADKSKWCEELKKELAEVLKDTMGGLEKLDCFLDAVEKLAVTSLHVFMENQVLHLPGEISLEHVQVIITAARLICPLLIEFKRDAEVFFSPRLQNVEVLSYQLDRYIQSTKKICDKLKKSSFSEFCLKNTLETVVNLDVDLSEDDMQRMLCHINQLDEIRMDPHFRMVFLFQEVACSNFIREFSMRQPRMLQFLKELEGAAVQLDRMNKGAKISSVAGGSVGAVGGVLSIIGLALIPVTAGLSLGLTIAGAGMGITSGVNSIVTTATEIIVNSKHQKKANTSLQSFMEDVQCLQDCLEEATKREVNLIDMAVVVGKVLWDGTLTGYNIYSFADAVSDYQVLSENAGQAVPQEANVLHEVPMVDLDISDIGQEMVASDITEIGQVAVQEGNVFRNVPRGALIIIEIGQVAVQEGNVFRNVPRGALDITEIGQVAVQERPLALTKSARVVGSFALNALFLGIDIFFICKDSISLAKGSEAEVSQFIRARAALWSSEMDSWQKIHDSLSEGLLTSEKKQGVLETPFYVMMEKKKQIETETEMEIPSDEVSLKNLKEKELCVIQ